MLRRLALSSRKLLLLLLLGFAPQSFAAGSSRAQADDAQGQVLWGMLKQYCAKCHNTVDWAGGVAFDTMSPEAVPEDAKVWEAAVRKLSGRLMPPPGNPQPRQQQIDQFVSWLEDDLDSASRKAAAGHVPIQRLNRSEYQNEVLALLGIAIKADDLLPPETEVGGFDNIAAALTTSPVFLEQYIAAARVVARMAVGDAVPRFSDSYYLSFGDGAGAHVDGMPLGTRGGIQFTHDFPADGEYRITLTDLDVGIYTWALETRQTLVILIDGRELFHRDLGGLEDLDLVDHDGATARKQIMDRFTNIPVRVAAGQHRVVITFVQRSEAETEEYLDNGNAYSDFFGYTPVRLARLFGDVRVTGPYGATHLSETASRAKIFICHPQTVAEERPCAERITEHLARLAFHRPVTPDDMASLMPFYDAAARRGGFNAGIEQIVAAVLASPDFLYRTIQPTPNTDDGKLHVLSNLELASRLSFFLWSQGPDDELLRVATAGQLTQPKVLDAQALRMLADPRAEALVDNFAFHWLDLDKLDSVVPDPNLFPDYSPQLRHDFTKEARLFLSSVLLDNRSVLDLLNANYTYLDEQLARHYGIDSVHGSQFRRVVLADPVRWGLLGKAAMLMETSYADRTSPVRRGAWILDKLMGTPPAQPPPNVNMNLDIMPGQKPTTVRARLMLHRANPSCSQCHGVIDPYGLALENFDATGAWRTFDHIANESIDADSVLPNGVKAAGVNDLRRQLMSRPDQFVGALTQKLLMYGLGRKLDYYDMPQVRAIVRDAKQENDRFAAIVLGIVNSDDFRMQAEPHAARPAGLKVAHSDSPNRALSP